MNFSKLHIRTLRFRNTLAGRSSVAPNASASAAPQLPRVTVRKGHQNTGALPVSVRTARQYLVFRERNDSATLTRRDILRSEPPSR